MYIVYTCTFMQCEDGLNVAKDLAVVLLRNQTKPQHWMVEDL